jgi:hypothetical protein
MTTMPDVITAPQAERHNRRRKGYPLPGSYWDRVQRGPRNPLLRNALDRLNKALEADSSPLARALIQEAMGAIRESEGA